MHIFLERYFRLLKEKGIDINDEAALSDNMLDYCIDEAITEYGNQAIYFSFRDKYQIKRLKRMAKRTLWVLQKQFAAGKFRPGDFEIQFRFMQEIENNGNVAARMALRGRIDRVDVYEAEDKVYIKVVDYKTGNNAFNLLGVYYGTSLQLMLYLDEAVKLVSNKTENKEKTVIPAAVLYYKIDDPLIEGDGSVQETEEEILSKLKVDGLISEEVEVLEAFDREFGKNSSGYESRVVPVATKKDGTLSAKSKTAQGRDLELICKYAVRKASDIGAAIIAGNVKAEPALEIEKDTCEFCSYHSICRFNPDISPVKDTPQIKEAEITAYMAKALEKDKKEGDEDGE